MSLYAYFLIQVCVCECECECVCGGGQILGTYPDYYHNDTPYTSSHNVGHINYALYPEDKVNFIVIATLCII